MRVVILSQTLPRLIDVDYDQRQPVVIYEGQWYVTNGDVLHKDQWDHLFLIYKHVSLQPNQLISDSVLFVKQRYVNIIDCTSNDIDEIVNTFKKHRKHFCLIL